MSERRPLLLLNEKGRHIAGPVPRLIEVIR
jgi:hypothetical protein